MRQRTLSSLFLRDIKAYPERCFVKTVGDDIGCTTSFLEASAIVQAWASIIEKHLQPGEVLLVASNSTSFIYIALAAAYTGVVVAPIQTPLQQQWLNHFVSRTNPKAAITDSLSRKSLEDNSIKCIAIASENGHPLHLNGLARKLLDPKSAIVSLENYSSRRSAGDSFNIQATSGSTDIPKLVLRSQLTTLYNGDTLALSRKAGDKERRILFMSMNYHGSSLSLLAMSLVLAAQLSIPMEGPGAPLEVFQELDPTDVAIAPRTLQKILRRMRVNHPQCEPCQIFGSSMEVLISWAEKADPDTLRQVNKHWQVVDTYASAELGYVAATPLGQWEEGWIGKLCPGVQAKLAEDGELLVKAPAPMLKYLGDEVATRQAFTNDGYYKTGDFAEFGEGGKVAIIGRKGDIFLHLLAEQDGPGINAAVIEHGLDNQINWGKLIALVGHRMPHMSALFWVSGNSDSASDPLGFMPPEKHRSLYLKARQTLQEFNALLKPLEKIERFALFNRQPAIEVLNSNGFKMRRNRKAVALHYADYISQLNSGDWPSSATLPV